MPINKGLKHYLGKKIYSFALMCGYAKTKCYTINNKQTNIPMTNQRSGRREKEKERKAKQGRPEKIK